MASGDVVNTAARLQSAAPENGILVDETTFRATERAIEYGEQRADRGEGEGRAGSASGAALEPKARVRRRRAPDRHERRSSAASDELEALVGALDRARREREPQLVTLVGVPGIGKSRLVWELFQRLEQGPELVRWRQGRSLPYGEGVSFWALGEMVKAQAGILETDDAARTEEKLRETVAALVSDSADAQWLERHLRPLVGLETGGEAGADRRGEAFAAWRRFFEALAEQRPLVLVFEDLHFADDGLLDFVDHLVDWASGVPLLVVGTARPELLARRPGWGGGKPNALTLSLSPLSDDETARLVHALLERPLLDAAVQETLLERAAGNPLYAEEFVRMVEEHDPAEELPLPETVQGLIAARIDALPAGGEGDPPGRGSAREGLLARRRRGARRRRAAGRPRSASTRSSARSSCAASAARRSRERRSTHSGTCSSATSPTARSRARRAPRSIARRRRGSRRSAGRRTRPRWSPTTT